MAWYPGFSTDFYLSLSNGDRKHTDQSLKYCSYCLNSALQLGRESLTRDGMAAAHDDRIILPLYAGCTITGPKSENISAWDGHLDGMEAAALAARAAIPSSTHIYLDIAGDATLTGPAGAYVVAWIIALERKGYFPAFRCSDSTSESVMDTIDTLTPMPFARLWLSQGLVDAATLHGHNLN
jgi:hypothetical protein